MTSSSISSATRVHERRARPFRSISRRARTSASSTCATVRSRDWTAAAHRGAHVLWMALLDCDVIFGANYFLGCTGLWRAGASHHGTRPHVQTISRAAEGDARQPRAPDDARDRARRRDHLRLQSTRRDLLGTTRSTASRRDRSPAWRPLPAPSPSSACRSATSSSSAPSSLARTSASCSTRSTSCGASPNTTARSSSPDASDGSPTRSRQDCTRPASSTSTTFRPRSSPRSIATPGRVRLPVDLRRLRLSAARGDGARRAVDRRAIVVAARDRRRRRAVLRPAQCR